MHLDGKGPLLRVYAYQWDLKFITSSSSTVFRWTLSSHKFSMKTKELMLLSPWHIFLTLISIKMNHEPFAWLELLWTSKDDLSHLFPFGILKQLSLNDDNIRRVASRLFEQKDYDRCFEPSHCLSCGSLRDILASQETIAKANIPVKRYCCFNLLLKFLR